MVTNHIDGQVLNEINPCKEHESDNVKSEISVTFVS